MDLNHTLSRIIEEIELLLKDEPFYSNLKKRNVEFSERSKSSKDTLLASAEQGTEDKVTAEMKKLEKEILACTKCELYKSRTRAVPGEGNYRTKLVIIGEGPGKDEDFQGKPFVGKAGQLLTKLLEEIGIKRKDVYITNVVKCRPPENRTPTFEEILACRGYLKRQLEVINPKVVLLLGATASRAVIGEEKITKIRGEIIELEGTIFLPTFHPAAVLRDESGKLSIIREDFKKLRSIIDKL